MTARRSIAPHETEIDWGPVATVPAPDLLALSDQDLAVTALVEAEAYRALSRAAVERLHETHRQLHRVRATVGNLRSEQRQVRAALGGTTETGQ